MFTYEELVWTWRHMEQIIKIYIPGSTGASHSRDKSVSNYRNISWQVDNSQSYSIV